MTHALRTALFIVLAVVYPVTAGAQDPPPEQPEERSTGLPSPITWTFNFDTG